MSRLFCIFLLVSVLAGCEKILHTEEISIGKITNYEQLVSAVGGVYATLTGAFDDNSFYAANVKGDDLNLGTFEYNYYYGKPSGYDYIVQDPRYKIDPTKVWISLYKAIVSVNNVLIQYKNISQQSNQVKEIVGEMYLVRAYCYFKLTRNYGQIPVINNIDINYDIPKASYDEIYKFIESDLKMAMELLPKNNNTARIPFVTPHRGSAKAMLAEVYLSWAGYPVKDASKYASAAQEAGEVIDSVGYFGFSLLNDFTWLWDKPHLMNSESVFSLYLPNPDNSEFINQYWGSKYFWHISYTSYYTGYCYVFSPFIYLTPPGNYSITTNFFPTEINFFNNYPASYRKEITFYETIYVPYIPNSNYIPPDTGYVHIDKDTSLCRIGYRKFYYDPYKEVYLDIEIDNSKPDTQRIQLYLGVPRIYLFRYAQTVLTYAEAMARMGLPDSKAYDCVNQIRRRAHHLDLNTPSAYDLQPGLSPGVFADSVVWERAWELCGEPEGRWYDLVRLEMVEDLPKLRNPKEGGPPDGVYNKSVYYSPMPASDTLLNPNLGNNK